ncbi:MAG: adenylate cyclase [Desulfobacterales bacterium]|nr:MAG: adenylate cyclase [Desulfobacterales bacterium]
MLEVEVKFFLTDNAPDRVRDALGRMGARRDGRVFERNLRLDDAAGSLWKKGCLLRLRRDHGARLTWKSPPDAASSAGGGMDVGQFKVYQELETDVGDIRITEQILSALGFTAVQAYEKYRETFHMDGVECCLDEMPFGTILELEGTPDRIRETAARLGLAWEERILDSYLALFSRLCNAMNLSARDLTFDAFSGLRLSPLKIAEVMAAARPEAPLSPREKGGGAAADPPPPGTDRAPAPD